MLSNKGVVNVPQLSTFATTNRSLALPLIWPDNSFESDGAKYLRKIREVNGPQFWTEFRDIFAYYCDTLPLKTFKMWAAVWLVPLLTTDRLQALIMPTYNKCLDEPELCNFLEGLLDPDIGYNRDTDFNNYFSVFDDSRLTANRVTNVSHLIAGEFKPKDLEQMETIVEIGAGIGDMADIVYKAGFKGKYIIYDFPELHRVQRWYHHELGLKNIKYVWSPDGLSSADLCIAAYSLTEMPVNLRRDIVSKIKDTKNWLLAYSFQNFMIDNKKYMTDEFCPAFADTHKITDIDITNQTFDGGGSRYTILKPL